MRPHRWGEARTRPVIALYSADARYVARIEAALDAAARVVATDRWERFERVIPAAACSIAVVEWLQTSPVFSRLTSLKTRLRLRPIVLVTSKDADNARALKDVSVEEVVWLSEVRESLWSAVRRANGHGLLHQVGQAVQRADHLPAVLRDSLAYACHTDRPLHSVTELARTIGRDRRTLWRHWRTAFGSHPPLRLEDVIDWLLLLHAAARKVSERSWAAVAAELKVHQHTLSRTAMRLASRPLQTLAADRPNLATQFDARVLVPLLAGRARNVVR
jgi:hypothetical protein